MAWKILAAIVSLIIAFICIVMMALFITSLIIVQEDHFEFTDEGVNRSKRDNNGIGKTSSRNTNK